MVSAIVGYRVGWALWSGITYLVGSRIFHGTATWGELLLRTLGFAQAPGVRLVLAIVPIPGGLLKLFVGIGLLVTGLVVIRQALDVSTGKAALTAVVGPGTMWSFGVVAGVVSTWVMRRGASASRVSATWTL